MKRPSVLLSLLVCVGCTGHRYERWFPVRSKQELERFVEELEGDYPDQRQDIRSQVQQLLFDLGGQGAQAKGEPGSFEETVCDPRNRYRILRYFNLLKIRAVPAGASADVREGVARQNQRKLVTMFGDEREAVLAAQRDPALGLALSGGGIRSASFSTGVLLALSELGVLDRVGYLSTVSGGGFAGAWYMLHRSKEERDLLMPGSLHLQHLAQNGHFLTGTHFSQSRVEIGQRLLADLLFLPVHWLANGLLDIDMNTRGPRTDYRYGIVRSFLYEQPMDAGEVLDLAYQSMARNLPSREVDRPFWVVNMHLALNDEDTSFRARSGDHFELTPLRAGADSAGYVEVPDFESGEAWVPQEDRFWMTPAYAVAASGAAADSSSLQQSTWVSGFLQAMNYDLGYYIAGWGRGFVSSETRSDCDLTLNHVLHYALTPFPLYSLVELPPLSWLIQVAGAQNVPGFSSHDQTLEGKKYYLTDGGHFDNLGAYALLRRGCRVIIVSDATRDTHVSDWDGGTADQKARAFDDLRRLEERLFSDFGVTVRWQHDAFRPVPDSNRGNGSGPAGGLLVGVIDDLPLAPNGASNGPVVVLVVKAAYDIRAMTRDDLGFIDAEKAAFPEFPNESTGQQLFSEEKVMAYRALGRAIVLANAPLFRAVRTAADGDPTPLRAVLEAPRRRQP